MRKSGSALKTKHLGIILICSILFLGAQEQEDLMKPLLLALVILLPVAKVAGWLLEKLGQPAVLGELLAGMLLGNLSFVGLHALDYPVTRKLRKKSVLVF
jgi:hypothetical protein